HILLSKHVADDLEQYPQWRSHLYDLGECEVKHGVKVSVVNLYTPEAGNPAAPVKFGSAGVTQPAAKTARSSTWPRTVTLVGPFLLLGLTLAAAGWFLSQRNWTKTGHATEKSIAVLPFENLSDEKQNAYFADGVQDEILTHLAKIADLKVISRTSVMPYKSSIARNLREIGKQLGVSHLLEGSVQRSANRVRVNAQLIDAS